MSDVCVKGYVHYASKDEPQYIIKSDKTDHVAIHKASTDASDGSDEQAIKEVPYTP